MLLSITYKRPFLLYLFNLFCIFLYQSKKRDMFKLKREELLYICLKSAFKHLPSAFTLGKEILNKNVNKSGNVRVFF